MQSITYKVHPLSYQERIISASSLHFDEPIEYFLLIQKHIGVGVGDEKYRYRIGLICYILRVYGVLSDQTIIHFMNFRKPSELSYYFGIIEAMKPFDEDVYSDLNIILRIAGSLDVDTVSVSVLYIHPKEVSDYEKENI